jgi:DNA sulfur modification protein DndD
MELLDISMVNYRRFSQPTTIQFAGGDKNITIIRAENGSGKTGILMALLFGLFGTVKYEQFQIEDDQDYMVSAPLLTNGHSATCTVTVNFMEEGEKYTIIREIKASNINGHIQQDNDHVLTHLYKEGIDTKLPKEKIDEFMNSIVGENIRGFLFFDGVKYTDLFKQNDKNTKHELQKIIEKMLNINDLDQTIAQLKGLSSNFSSGKTSTKTATEIAKWENTKKEIEGLIKSKNDALNESSKKLATYSLKRQEWISKAASLDKYRTTAANIEKYANEINTQKDLLNTSFKTLNSVARVFLLNAIYTSAAKESRPMFQMISSSRRGGADLVRAILDSGKCICCDDPLTEEKKEKLKNYLNAIESETEYCPQLISETSDDIFRIDHLNDDSAFNEQIQAINQATNNLISLRSDMAKEEAKIPTDILTDDVIGKIKEASSQEGSFTTLINTEQTVENGLNNDINTLEVNKGQAEKKLDELNEQAAAEEGQQARYKYYSDTRDGLIKLKEQYLSEAQKAISEQANSFFLKLISDDDKAKFAKLVLDDDYSIKVYQVDGHEGFGQMSAGQKLLASMAFVMGLTAVASNAKPTCNFPLVMDTPFSNLDLRNRGSLINLMPSVVKQWIITPIDTELTDKEIGFFDKGGKVGSVYWLKKSGPATVLVQCNNILDLTEGY